MRYPWLFIIPLIAFIVIVASLIVRFLKSKDYKKQHRSASLIAHTKAIRELPEYESAQKRYRFLLWLAAVVFIISISSATILASRPITITESKNEQSNRDVMLCLDVSGSMIDLDKAVLNYFNKLIAGMEGERIGVVVFNGVYATMSPLTDDYLAISEVLEDIKNDTSRYDTLLSPNGASSQIGLGLAGCIYSFDKVNETDRSRAIIFATDNLTGAPIIDLDKAAQMAKSYDITVYGLYASTLRTSGNYMLSSESEFSDAVSLTGGTYYRVANRDVDDHAIKQIIESIMKTEAKKYDKVGHLARVDSPLITSIIFTVSSIILLVIVWRLRIW